MEVLPGSRFPDLVNHDPMIVGQSYVLGDDALAEVPPPTTVIVRLRMSYRAYLRLLHVPIRGTVCEIGSQHPKVSERNMSFAIQILDRAG